MPKPKKGPRLAGQPGTRSWQAKKKERLRGYRDRIGSVMGGSLIAHQLMRMRREETKKKARRKHRMASIAHGMIELAAKKQRNPWDIDRVLTDAPYNPYRLENEARAAKTKAAKAARFERSRAHLQEKARREWQAKKDLHERAQAIMDKQKAQEEHFRKHGWAPGLGRKRGVPFLDADPFMVREDGRLRAEDRPTHPNSRRPEIPTPVHGEVGRSIPKAKSRITPIDGVRMPTGKWRLPGPKDRLGNPLGKDGKPLVAIYTKTGKFFRFVTKAEAQKLAEARARGQKVAELSDEAKRTHHKQGAGRGEPGSRGHRGKLGVPGRTGNPKDGAKAKPMTVPSQEQWERQQRAHERAYAKAKQAGKGTSGQAGTAQGLMTAGMTVTPAGYGL